MRVNLWKRKEGAREEIKKVAEVEGKKVILEKKIMEKESEQRKQNKTAEGS